MLAGRLAAMAIAFLTQVVVVRYLSKDDYGAFAYAVSAILLLQSLLPLGLDRADTRFLALYDERDDHGRLLGVILVEAATVVALGGAAVAVAVTFRGELEGSLIPGGTTFAVLLAMLALAPLQAIDTMVLNVFALFASPWTVFFRRYVLDPVLRLLVAIAMVVAERGVLFLALGFVAVGVIGLALYTFMLVRLLRRLGMLTRVSMGSIALPLREVFAFSLPLLVTNVVAVAVTELAAVVLGHYGEASDVAAFRAVAPFAALNFVVMFSFTTLFTPAAARLCARDDRAGLRELYWRSARWVAVLTFPVLCVTTALAQPVTVASFGDRYSGSALYLALLSIGYYFNAALGFNGLTVVMLGRLRYMTIANLGVLGWMVAANLLLIPRWGTIGAVVAVLSTIVVHNLAKQAGLGFGAGIGVVDRGHVVVLAQLAAVAGVLSLITISIGPPLLLGLFLVAGVSALMLRVMGPALDLGSTFPEIARLPVVRWVLR